MKRTYGDLVTISDRDYSGPNPTIDPELEKMVLDRMKRNAEEVASHYNAPLLNYRTSIKFCDGTWDDDGFGSIDHSFSHAPHFHAWWKAEIDSP